MLVGGVIFDECQFQHVFASPPGDRDRNPGQTRHLGRPQTTVAEDQSRLSVGPSGLKVTDESICPNADTQSGQYSVVKVEAWQPGIRQKLANLNPFELGKRLNRIPELIRLARALILPDFYAGYGACVSTPDPGATAILYSSSSGVARRQEWRWAPNRGFPLHRILFRCRGSLACLIWADNRGFSCVMP